MGKTECLRLLRALLAGLTLAGFATLASASVTVCVDPGKLLTLRVSFKAWFENAVIVSDSRGRDLIGFNNYFGRGAAGEWKRGAATWRAPKTSDRRCYIIAGRHKAGPPNPALPWQPSSCRVGRASIGFEDGGTNGRDRSYDDARVTIRGGYVSAITAPCRAAAGNRPNAQSRKYSEYSAPKKSPPAAQMQRPEPVAVEPPAARADAEPKPAPTAARNGATRAGETAGAGFATGSASVGVTFKLPEFPFPPPDPSARLLIPAVVLTSNNPAPSFGSVATRMEGALASNGYSTISYFAVPGGFTLVTQLERINPDATPAAE